MEWRNSTSETDRAAQKAAADVVAMPQAHDGIGNALRRAFVAHGLNVPEEFAKLLAKLH
ncbi:MAG TPA: hypothetical protein VNZ43_08405 [Sphingomonadaceae bacterium]|nr:hypothetical protein [Sphingomonadaceae bacterium]